MPSQNELGGYLLGMYERSIRKALGDPSTTDSVSGHRALIYYVTPDKETFFVFAVTEEEEGVVSSIQLTGKPRADLPTFQGVSLGDSRATVEAKFGESDEAGGKASTPGDPVKYKNRNYSFVYGSDGKLSSIKIFDGEGFPDTEKSTRPDLAGFAKAIADRDRDKIFEYLAPDVDIYTKDDETVTFAGPPRKEIDDEKTMISRYLYGGTGSLRDLLTPSLLMGTEVKDRKHLESGDDDRIFPTAEFPKTSGIQEIVWHYSYGRWRVWEIDLNPD